MTLEILVVIVVLAVGCAALQWRRTGKTLTDVALHEYLGIARYHVYNWLGWNPARQRPGQA